MVDSMREIRTFILRLLVDSGEPRALRGKLRAVADDDEKSFVDEQSLLLLLHETGQTTEEACESKDESPMGVNQTS